MNRVNMIYCLSCVNRTAEVIVNVVGLSAGAVM